jgi:thioredoxin-dependent peroxiredoxin
MLCVSSNVIQSRNDIYALIQSIKIMTTRDAIEYEIDGTEAFLRVLDACENEIEDELRNIQAQKRAYALHRRCLLHSIAPQSIAMTVVPAVTFKARVRDPSVGGPNPFAWKDVTTAELFGNKRCVLFGVPGAFTPTCTNAHLPGYVKRYAEIKACGIDEVYCLSVNDAFVMRQWGLKLGLQEETKDASNPLNPGNFSKVKLIPDGACLFTRGMGMSCAWVSERGFGERSWRYSAVINNGIVEKIFIEV